MRSSKFFDVSEQEKIAELCVRLGASSAQATTMAGQLLKRADQLAQERNLTREAALAHLIQLMVQGRQGVAPDQVKSPEAPSKQQL